MSEERPGYDAGQQAQGMTDAEFAAAILRHVPGDFDLHFEAPVWGPPEDKCHCRISGAAGEAEAYGDTTVQAFALALAQYRRRSERQGKGAKGHERRHSVADRHGV